MKKEITLMVLGAMAVFGLFVWFLGKVSTPASMTEREERVREIKLCTDNDLKAYQGGDGTWFCEPK